MKKEKNITTEQAILKAAEQEFLNKGYTLSKTTEIAEVAGVNHAMLHYYFRTKENLFNMVFQQKIEILAKSFIVVFDQDLPFFEKLRLGIERHFDIIAENPKLPFFIFNEILSNEKRKKMFIETIRPEIKEVFQKIQLSIQEEIEKGNIRSITSIDLILNIISLNVFVFVVHPIIREFIGNHEQNKNFFEHRKKNNVDIIISQLKINN